MTKLKILTESSLEGQNMHLTHYKQFLDKNDAQNDGQFYYQDVKLRKYTDTKNILFQLFMVTLLDTSIWPIDDENLAMFGENEISHLIKHFNHILLSDSCDIYQMQTEWDRLKNHIKYILENNFKTTYLNKWKKNFTNSTILEEYKKVMHIFEILLVASFTNAKVEQGYLNLNRIKTD